MLFNRAAEQMFRVRREEALGTWLDRFLPARFREAHRKHIQHFGSFGVAPHAAHGRRHHALGAAHK